MVMPSYYIDPVNGNDANDGGGWTKLLLASGTGTQPVAGEVVTGAGGATGKVIKITGTWATAPTVYLYNRNATAFVNGEAITFSGGGAATNGQGTPYTDVVCSFKTLYKTFAAGDNIYVAKCAEPQQQASGITATNGSISVTGITGWTPAQYNIIRFDSDDMIYMVKSYSGGTITLYRPYRGVTGTSKSCNLLTSYTAGSSNDLKASGTGTSTSKITLYGGTNVLTNLQDGFSIWNHGDSYTSLCANHSFTGWNFVRVGSYRPSNGYAAGTFTLCDFSFVFYLRLGSNGGQMKFFNCTGGNLIYEAFNLQITALVGTVLSDFDIYDTGTVIVFNGWRSSRLIRPKINGAASQILLKAAGSGTIFDTIMEDPKFDELNVGAYSIFNPASYDACFFGNLRLVNPSFPPKTPILGFYDAPWYWGDLELSNINGSPTDYRKFVSIGETSKYLAQIQRDDITFRTAAPAIKVMLNTSAYPYSHKFNIPCDAGVQKTLSVYLFKNSNPGSTITLNTAGSGYAVGDLFSVIQAGGGSCILQVATISGSGVATFNIVSGGYNYSVANALLTTTLTGAGSGCKVNITAVGTGYGSLTRPIMRLRWITGSAGAYVTNVSDTVMPDTNNSWVQLSAQITPSITAAVTMEIIVQSPNAGATVWIDDIGKA
jgi:hypothetical protein